MQVKKRDGRLEEFDREKLKRGFVAAGVADDEAEGYTGQVEDWAQSEAQDDVIASTAIWAKVVEILEESDSEAASRYKAYREA